MSAFPGSHVDLLDRPLPAVLTTEMPDGRSQSTVVWFNRDGGHILLNTMREFQKARNLRARPRATLLVVEREGDQRWIEVRGSVLLEEDGALEHLNARAGPTRPERGRHRAEALSRRAAEGRSGARAMEPGPAVRGRATDPRRPSRSAGASDHGGLQLSPAERRGADAAGLVRT